VIRDTTIVQNSMNDVRVVRGPAFDQIVDDCRAPGGTVTGEYGVDCSCLRAAADELEPRAISMDLSVKDTLHPWNAQL
jgi:hypothetical protein